MPSTIKPLFEHHQSCKIVPKGNDAIIQVRDVEHPLLTELTYEDLLSSRNSGMKFWHDDVTMTYEWLMSQIRRVRAEYGMNQFHKTLTELLGEGNFSIEPVTSRNKNFFGEYVCIPKVENNNLSEAEIKNRQDIWGIVGFPVSPEIVFASFRQDERSGWQLSLSDNQQTPISFVDWDDLDGITSMAKSLIDLDTCLVAFALLHPELARILVEKEVSRKNNEEALKIIGLEKPYGKPS